MELDELTVRVRVAADGAMSALRSMCGALSTLGAAETAAQAGAALLSGAAAGMGAALAAATAQGGLWEQSLIRQRAALQSGTEAARQYAAAVQGESGLELSGRTLKEELAALDHLSKTGQATVGQQLGALIGLERKYTQISVKERYDLEERLYKAREGLRRQGLQAELDALSHQKAMGEATAQSEIAQLERILQAHQTTASERMAIEEQLQSARTRLLSEQTALLTALNAGVESALRGRYEAMLAAETDALDESRSRWRAWQSEATAAVEGQIKALERLAAQESEEKQSEQEQRAIVRLREEMAYAQDEYSRAMLARELDKALEGREARLSEQERARQKAALRESLSAISETAQAQLTALSEQEQALQSAYRQRLSASALAAEAEKLTVQASQDELLALLSQYGSQYDTLGRTLGQRLAAGFAEGARDIEGFVSELDSRLSAAQRSAASSAVSSAESFYAAHGQTTVNQTNVFNQPVESPSDTARRIAQVNEELGLLLERG